MSKSRVQELLDEIATEVQSVEVNSATTHLSRELSQDVRDYLALSVKPAPPPQSLMEQAQALEVEFAQSHPRIEGIVRELIDLLAKMGI